MDLSEMGEELPDISTVPSLHLTDRGSNAVLSLPFERRLTSVSSPLLAPQVQPPPRIHFLVIGYQLECQLQSRHFPVIEDRLLIL